VDIVDGVAAQPFPRCYSNQSRNVSNRYSSRISEALQRTLLINHPGANGELLLEVPWILERDTGASPANFPSASKWLKLSQSSYFRKFHEFREHNEKFSIGGQSFRDFFPQSGKESVDIAFTLRCMRLALLSLDQRALMTTGTGYLGLAPKAVQQGDVVAILLGCRCPIVLRPCCDNIFHVIGECYIHELMDGEILNQESGKNPLEREFVLC